MHGIDSPPRPPLIEESDDGGFVGGFTLPSHPPSMGDIGLGSPSSTPPSRHISTNGHPFHDDDARSSSSGMSMNRSASSPTMPPGQTPQLPPAVPATVKRYSLVDKPMAIPSVIVDDAPRSPDQGDRPTSPELPMQYPPLEPPSHEPPPAPAIANSLAALKQSDALERRASKRFSTYTFTKMTGTRLGGAGNRKSMVASSLALTPGDLAVLTEAEESPGPVTPKKRERSTRRARQPPIQEQDEEVLPPAPAIPAAESAKEESIASDTQSETQTFVSPDPPPSAPNKPFTVFMQVGREVKKATVEPGLTMAMLRILFMDKFSYSPGMDSFPAIYIRDGSSGIQYELEDMDEMKEKCLLSLNIERELRRLTLSSTRYDTPFPHQQLWTRLNNTSIRRYPASQMTSKTCGPSSQILNEHQIPRSSLVDRSLKRHHPPQFGQRTNSSRRQQVDCPRSTTTEFLLLPSQTVFLNPLLLPCSRI